MKIHAVFNRDGGTFRTTDMPDFVRRARTAFQQKGHDFSADVVAGKNVVVALKSAISDPKADVVLVGGGDGTVSAAAALAWNRGATIAVVPAGTMNLFARAMHMPLDLDQALAALAEGEVESLDIGSANGTPFIHQYSVGFHSRVIRLRESYPYNSQSGKIFASFRAFAQVAASPPRFQAEIECEGKRWSERISALSVSNNKLVPGLPPLAGSLQGGELALYVASDVRTRQLVRITAAMLLGRELDENWVEQHVGQEVVLRFENPPQRARAVLDGELVPVEPKVTIKIHPGSLKTLVPRRAASAPARTIPSAA